MYFIILNWKKRWFFISDLHSLCSLSRSGRTIVNDEGGKDMEGSGCGLVMMKLGVLGADSKIIFVTIGWWFFFLHRATAPSLPDPHYRGFTITLRHATLDRTRVDGWLARRRDIYLTAHNSPKRQTSMSPPGFEPIISASERPQTHDRVVIAGVMHRHFLWRVQRPVLDSLMV
jgi:hypothetical protein